MSIRIGDGDTLAMTSWRSVLLVVVRFNRSQSLFEHRHSPVTDIDFSFNAVQYAQYFIIDGPIIYIKL
jgi:hypothetical protein